MQGKLGGPASRLPEWQCERRGQGIPWPSVGINLRCVTNRSSELPSGAELHWPSGHWIPSTPFTDFFPFRASFPYSPTNVSWDHSLKNDSNAASGTTQYKTLSNTMLYLSNSALWLRLLCLSSIHLPNISTSSNYRTLQGSRPASLILTARHPGGSPHIQGLCASQ